MSWLDCFLVFLDREEHFLDLLHGLLSCPFTIIFVSYLGVKVLEEINPISSLKICAWNLRVLWRGSKIGGKVTIFKGIPIMLC